MSASNGKRSVIEIRGARVNNLKNIDIDIPRDAFVVVTGLSGSGKSSLAFDTLYAEANRRYVESLSSYARNFMEGYDKPDVDSMKNLSPAISIDQKSVSRSPRSTVGTMTEVYDYLRILFAKVGTPCCPKCHQTLTRKSPQRILGELLEQNRGCAIAIVAESPQLTGKNLKDMLELEHQLEHAVRGLAGYADRQGVIIDQRYNGGGITPDYLIEWMQRKPLYYYMFRGGSDIATPVNPAPPVKVMLINEWNGSAAETGAFIERFVSSQTPGRLSPNATGD